MIKNFKLKFKNYLLDILFPKYCVNCFEEAFFGQPGSWLCFNCAQKIIPVVSQVCPECEKLSENGKYHKKCAKEKDLKGIIAASYFKEGPIREMIHNLKYNGVRELGLLLADLMTKALGKEFGVRILESEKSRTPISKLPAPVSNLQSPNSQLQSPVSNLQSPDSNLQSPDSNLRSPNFIITFVPMHWSRQARRGYNHAEVLARVIGLKTNIEVVDLLKKSKQTKRQAELSGNSRRKNLQGTFILKPGVSIKNRKIIIVDDVATTGTTLNECAAVLKQNGAKEIWGLVVARG